MARYEGLLERMVEEKREDFAKHLDKVLGKRERGDLAKIAAAVGVLPTTVTLWLKAEAFPSDEHIPKIAEYCGLSIEDLLGEELYRYYKRAETKRRKELRERKKKK